jgi:DNA (cytosine-5)-methyltransferase 1
MTEASFQWYEFFAGGGMARLGMSAKWKCTFANEWCEKKAASYRAFFDPCPELVVKDVAELKMGDLPGKPDLVWASFPCQDLSLAGSGAGLNGERSGTFRPFWGLIKSMVREGRAPAVVVLENVVGTLTSHQGSDFTAIVRAFAGSGYRVGALVIDAVRFLPQSRPRLFLVGAQANIPVGGGLICRAPLEPWHTRTLVRAAEILPQSLQPQWVWWDLPVPHRRVPSLESLIEENPTTTSWHTPAETKRLLTLMDSLHRKKVDDARRIGGRWIGTVYKRTRPNGDGEKMQRAEVRFDGIAGCLRTPVGGSSRQTVIIVEDGVVRSRLLSPREAARLMGVPDSYALPRNYNEGYHLFGDGVAVPVVSWLERHLLNPMSEHKNLERVA